MSWYVNTNNETRGPTGEETVIRWIREGNLTSGKVCRVGSDQWIELTGHLPFATALREVAPPPPLAPNAGATLPVAQGSSFDAQGLQILLTPVVALGLMLVAEQYFSLFFRSFVVSLIGVGTVLVTAIMIATEAGRLQMGKAPVEDGAAGNGAGAWFLASLLLWVVAFPLFLHKRHWYGPPSKAAWAVLVAALFIGGWSGIVWAANIQLAALGRFPHP